MDRLSNLHHSVAAVFVAGEMEHGGCVVQRYGVVLAPRHKDTLAAIAVASQVRGEERVLTKRGIDLTSA